jgi:ribosome-binding protein aMBF1 (putative translation factor)
MHPNEELTKKIEKFFGIKLMEKYQEERIQKKKEKKELTLGDIVKIK